MLTYFETRELILKITNTLLIDIVEVDDSQYQELDDVLEEAYELGEDNIRNKVEYRLEDL
jgi:hypothetical protein